jgi:hypothetical protein
VEEHLCGCVIDFVGVDGANDGQFIGDCGQFRQQFGEDLSAVAVLAELPWGTCEYGCFADEREIAIAGHGFRAGLTVAANEFGFAVEQIELRGCSDHVQADEMFGFGREVWQWCAVGSCAGAVSGAVEGAAGHEAGAASGCEGVAGGCEGVAASGFAGLVRCGVFHDSGASDGFVQVEQYSGDTGPGFQFERAEICGIVSLLQCGSLILQQLQQDLQFVS